MKQTHVTLVTFNPWLRCIWIERCRPMPDHAGPHWSRRYALNMRSLNRLWKLIGNWHWSQDHNGCHLRRNSGPE